MGIVHCTSDLGQEADNYQAELLHYCSTASTIVYRASTLRCVLYDGHIQNAHTPVDPQLRIRQLFGHLSYNIPPDRSDKDDKDRLIIIYGDNGSGKTTILKMLFALLSPRRNRGDKTCLASIMFKHFEIIFNDGSIVPASRHNDSLLGTYTARIFVHGTMDTEFIIEAAENGNVGNTTGVSDFIGSLASIFDIGLYILPDDRRLDSTYSTGDEEESQLSILRRLQMTAGGEWVARPSVQSESHHLNVEPILAQLNAWLRQHAATGSNTGEENATSIYQRVVQQIARLPSKVPSAEIDYEQRLTERLVALGRRVERFSRYGLIAPFPADQFIEPFRNASFEAKSTIATVLEPYIGGIEARLTALEGMRKIVTNYVEIANSFFVGKHVSYTYREGVRITAREQNLSPNLLSSGEKQLLVLLSGTILAREHASIFLIDEPELSLNVKWQRQLIQALLRSSEGASTQYILASHSLELITKYRSSAIRLVPLRSAGDRDA
jgi:energy-coupling factor transporter ATP-binding protein EcfA2